MSRPTATLAGVPPVDRYDGFLFDLDGVIYRGSSAVPHAVDSLRKLRRRRKFFAFVTNNAFRTPNEVAHLLCSLGVWATASMVVTSAEAGARTLADTLPTGAPVLVIGGRALEVALCDVGLRPVRSARDRPRAVLQGWAPEVDWTQLAEAAYALVEDIPWVATNTDLTVPKERGLTPGNGTLVAAVAAATNREPQVIGKPEPALFHSALRRTGLRRPLVIGDRLDTDVAAAIRGSLDSALVLTGATSEHDALDAPESQRPTYVWRDLRALFGPPDQVGAAPRRQAGRRVSIGRPDT